jgi:hypothetical protein
MKRHRFVFASVLCGCLGTFSLAVHPANGQIVTTIDFESIPGLTPAPSYFQHTEAPFESQLSDQLISATGVWFYSELPNAAAVALVELGAGHATSGKYGIGSIDTQSRIDYTVPLMASFFLPEDPTLAAVTDVVALKADLQVICCETLTLEAFGIDGSLLASTSIEVDANPGYLEVSHPGIHSVRVLQESGTVAWDDFSIGALTPVPEPGTLALLTLATLAGATLRRRPQH